MRNIFKITFFALIFILSANYLYSNNLFIYVSDFENDEKKDLWISNYIKDKIVENLSSIKNLMIINDNYINDNNISEYYNSILSHDKRINSDSLYIIIKTSVKRNDKELSLIIELIDHEDKNKSLIKLKMKGYIKSIESIITQYTMNIINNINIILEKSSKNKIYPRTSIIQQIKNCNYKSLKALKYYLKALSYLKNKKHKEAIEYCEKSLKKQYSKNTLNLLAEIYIDKNEFDKANDILKDITQFSMNVNSKLNIRSIYLNAIMYFKKNEYKESLKYFERLKYLLNKLYSKHHLKLKETYYYMGYLYIVLAEYDNALNLYKDILKTYNNYTDQDTHSLIKLYYLIGKTYRYMGQYFNAIDSLNKAQNIYDRFTFINNTTILYSKIELAFIQLKKSNFYIALELLGNVEKQLTDDIDDVNLYIKLYYTYARLYYKTHNIIESEKYIKLCLENLDVEGTELITKAEIYNYYSRILAKNRLFTKAFEYQQKAHQEYVNLKIANENNIYFSYFYETDGFINFYQNKYDKGLISLEKAISIQEVRLGYNHPRLADSYELNAELYLQKGKKSDIINRNKSANTFYEQSLVNYKRVLEIKLKYTSENNDTIKNLYSNIATIYYLLNNKREYRKYKEILKNYK